MSLEWITDAFKSLPGCDDDLFRKLWIERRLRLIDEHWVADYLDEYSARLICATLRRSERLFLVLPDFQSYRPALLFATALIRTWYDSQTQQEPCIDEANNPRVLYLGATVGIRTQLQQVTVGEMGLNLAEVFQQQHIGKKTRSRQRNKNIEDLNSTLPKVFTIYAPVDPIGVIEKYNPQWIAVDCNEAEDLNCLKPLLQYSLQRNLPVIAWGQNPFSKCIVDFAEEGRVFNWPSKTFSNKSSDIPISFNLQRICSKFNSTQIIKSALMTDVTTQIQPIVLEGITVVSLETSFREVYHSLVRSSQGAFGRLAQDALRIHWKYLRSLESLSIPWDFYEAESTQFWGMKSFEQLHNECEHFRKACYQNYTELAAQLEEVKTWLEKIQEQFQTDGSPLWHILSKLLSEEPPKGEARLVIFTSRARKRLFVFALLARYNLTEEDLRRLRTWVFSLDELRLLYRQPNQDKEIAAVANFIKVDETLAWHPLLVGLPSSLLTPKLQPIFLQETVDVLIYPHQTAALARQTTEWARRLSPDISQIAEVLSSLSGHLVPQELPELPSRINMAYLREIELKRAKIPCDLGIDPLWLPDDPVIEVARLLQSDEATDDERLAPELSETGVGTSTDEEQESWCQSAVEIYFDQGWQACFAPDAKIYVILADSAGQKTDERYVRSLRIGERVVAIPGQRRQNLYDLIISRVHGHPTIELHLALIRRWQEDVVSAYRRWQQYGIRNLDELLRQMQNRGSSLTSPFTLRQWLWGNTLCPEEPQDLRRLAEVLDMDFVRSYYPRIERAAKRLRGLHRGLSRRLNSWLEQQATGLVGKRDEDVIDEELGLTFSDFRNSLLILRVEKVQNIHGLFLRDNLGKFERNL